ncbi:MAG: polysaccharide biosynthesis/export family protein [Kiritimatiellia bacterium]
MVKAIQLGWTAVLAAGLLAGCMSPAPRNRKVYDRYAELVAQRSRAAEFKPAPTAAAATAPQTPMAQPAAPVARPSARAIPAEPRAPATPAPVKVMPPPAAAPAARPAAVPPSAPPPSAPAARVSTPAVPRPAELPPPAGIPVPDSEAPPSSDGVAYVLKPSDAVQIFLRGIPNAEIIEAVVDENGRVSLPFINEVMASGLTASELARSIRSIYLEQGIYQNISVNVVVPMRSYFVQGEVRAPGRFQLIAAMRVSQAIAGAGGYSEFASGQVVVKRGGKIAKTIRNARRLERTPEDDILLEPDDIIEVKRSLW